jgi:hypothetical protein
MSKKLIFLNILIMIGILLTACGNSASQTPVQNQPNGIHEISAVIQATDQPPVVPTIVINPTPAPGGSAPLSMNNLLVYVLVGAIILIALVAILRKS